MLFTYTNSPTYELKSEDVYEEFLKLRHLFDFSNFSKDSKFYENEIVISKMKVVNKGISIKFVGLKSKMHLMLLDDDRESSGSKE